MNNTNRCYLVWFSAAVVIAAMACSRLKPETEPPNRPAASTQAKIDPTTKPTVAQQTMQITESGIGPIKLGMSLGEARKAFPTARFERGSDGEGAALVDVFLGNDPMMSLGADEDDSGGPVDWSKQIKSIECFSPLCVAPKGAHPGSLVVDVEKIYGKTKNIVQSEIESRQYIEFQSQPARITFRLDYTGIFAARSRQTKQFNPKGKIYSAVVSSY